MLFEALGKQPDKLSLKFELNAGEVGKLFGSVTSQMIVDGNECAVDAADETACETAGGYWWDDDVSCTSMVFTLSTD